jgi:hypothetical protein
MLPAYTGVLQAWPDPLAYFDRWVGPCRSFIGDACVASLVAGQETTIVAHFVGAVDVPLYVGTVGAGFGTVDSDPPADWHCSPFIHSTIGPECSAKFERGLRVTLRATAQPGSQFLGWFSSPDIGCSGSGDCQLEVFDPVFDPEWHDVRVSALFAPLVDDPRYTAIDLGLQDGFLNSKGEVAGRAKDKGGIVRRASGERIPFLEDQWLTVFGLSDLGDVAGRRLLGTTFTTFVFHSTTGVVELQDGRDVLGISLRGLLVGSLPGTLAPGARRAFLDDGRSVVELAPQALSSEALAVNDRGIAGGWVMTADGQHAALFEAGQVTDLGTFASATTATVTAIASDGRAVGWASGGGGNWIHGFRVEAGVLVPLPTLYGLSNSRPFGINASGVAVGEIDCNGGAFNEGSYRAVAFKDGVASDLNFLVQLPYETLEQATSIDDQGRIVATSGGRAYLLVPR